jgi:ubiquinone/menaquinone biosynthesis C-methylase UbiE
MTIAETRGSFDSIAADYDKLWSGTDSGYWPRRAVWDAVQPLFGLGDHVLDLGCGTGVDAAAFMARGVKVMAVDASAEMVQVARSKGVPAQHLAAKHLHRLDGRYDGAISNFGVLNCLPDLRATAKQLARLVQQGGHLALCFMGKLCAWETAHYLFSGQFRKAIRRWSTQPVPTSLGINVWYPSVNEVSKAFSPEFRLRHWQGIGIFVPPSFIHGLGRSRVEFLASIDRRIAGVPVIRALSDHRLLILERV